MKKIFKLFVYLLLFILFFLIFLPKESFYNFAEKELAKQNIILSNEIRIENLFSLDINKLKIYYEGIEGANIKNINVLSFFFYSKVNIENIKLLDSLSSFFPPKIANINLSHSILDYENIDLIGNGDFGSVAGQINILSRTVTLNLKPSSKMKIKYSKILSQMKLKEGKYIYEYRF
jgi:hypothetical protein